MIYNVNFEKESIEIITPATSANVGAGFDCFGLALDIYNKYRITRTKSNERIVIWENDKLLDDDKNLVHTTLNFVLDEYYHKTSGYELTMMEQNIPVSRGMGSSSASIVAGILAAAWIVKDNIKKYDVLKLATRFEGHPDNAAPAIYGEFCLSHIDKNKNFFEDNIINKRIDFIKGISLLVAYPDFELSTKKARSVMPKNYIKEDVVKNIAYASMLISSIHTSDLELFSKSLRDKIHEPYRYPLIKNAEDLVEDMKKTYKNLLGSTISGSGSAILFYFENNNNKIEITDEVSKIYKNWTFKNIGIDNLGARYE